MFRVGDTVRICNRPIPSAFILGVITAALAGTYTILDESGNTHEAIGTELRMEKAAPPKVLDGVTVRFAENNMHAGTVTRVNGTARVIDFIMDTETRNPRNNEDFDQPDTYSYTPNPNGVPYTARLRSDGNWYLEGTDTKVTVGYRETAFPPVETAAPVTNVPAAAAA